MKKFLLFCTVLMAIFAGQKVLGQAANWPGHIDRGTITPGDDVITYGGTDIDVGSYERFDACDGVEYYFFGCNDGNWDVDYTLFDNSTSGLLYDFDGEGSCGFRAEGDVNALNRYTSTITGQIRVIMPAFFRDDQSSGTSWGYLNAVAQAGGAPTCTRLGIKAIKPATPGTPTGGGTICSGGSRTLTRSGSPAGTGITWYWQTSTIGQSTTIGSGTTLNVSPGSTTTYYVRARTCNGYWGTASAGVTVTVVPDPSAPTATKSPNAATVCAGANLTLTSPSAPSGGTGTCNIEYEVNNSNIWSTTVPTISNASVGTQTINIRTSCTGSGCLSGETTYSWNVIADPSTPTASQSPSAGTVCVGATLSLTGVSSPSGGTGTCNVEYEVNNSGTWSTTAPSITAALGTNRIAIRTSCTGSGCLSGESVYTWTGVADPSTPTATKSPNVAAVCEGTTLSLTGVSAPSGGAGTCNIEYEVNNSGTWSTVPPSVTATVGTNSIAIRTNCNGSGCDISGESVYSWTVNQAPTAPTSISSSLGNTICNGETTTLSFSGGIDGSGATYEWFSGSCGGPSAGTGATINVSPTSNTTYYVRRVGNTACTNQTSCASLIIMVDQPPTAPTGISGSTTICNGSSTTLSIVGGSDGSGATYEWFTGSCSGTPFATSASVVVSPTSNTTYFVRRVGSTACTNTTLCASTLVVVQQAPSAPPTTVNVTPTANCSNALPPFIQLIAAGGSPGTGGTANWYTGSCGGFFVASGSSPLVANPGVTTTYFVRYENPCGTTSCATVTYTVDEPPTAPTGITSSLGNTICNGETTMLTISGGSDGSGATYEWFTGACAGIPFATTASVNVSPTSNTTYFVRRVGNTTCLDITACASQTITVDPEPTFASAGADFDACIDLPSTMGASSPAVGTGTWTWSGPGTVTYSGGTNANDNDAQVSMDVAGDYTGTWTISNGVCPDATPADQVIVSVNSVATNAALVTGTSVTAQEVCVESPWTYYATAAKPDEYLFAIRKNGNTFTADITITDVPGTAPIESLGGQPNVRGTWLISRYWNAEITSGGISTDVDIRFYIDDQERIDASDDADAFVLANPWPAIPIAKTPLTFFKTPSAAFDPSTHLINGDFTFTPTYLGSGTSGTSNGITYYELTGITSFSGGTGGFSVNDGGPSPLPVELLSFNAKAVNNTYIQLDWATATEVNNDGFEVLRSTDGVNFERIAWLEGNGTSNEINTYVYEDREVSKGITYYYQLRQVDYDGQSELFDVVSARLEGRADFFIGNLVPNPSKDNQVVTVDIEASSEEVIRIQVYNHMGVRVASQENSISNGENDLEINVSDLAAGTYFINFESTSGTETRKLVVIK